MDVTDRVLRTTRRQPLLGVLAYAPICLGFSLVTLACLAMTMDSQDRWLGFATGALATFLSMAVACTCARQTHLHFLDLRRQRRAQRRKAGKSAAGPRRSAIK